MILLIDNFDSFVFNLARYFQRCGESVRVLRNNQISIAEIEAMAPDAIVISPGPCTPNEAGVSLDVVARLGDRFPILGICLGHQVIAQALGGTITRSSQPMHGKACPIQHRQVGIFAGLPMPMRAARYHSLIVEEASLPAELEITSRDERGTVMSLEHRKLPIVGLQFHPESILTEGGYQLLQNFLKRVGRVAPQEDSSPSRLQQGEWTQLQTDVGVDFEAHPTLGPHASHFRLEGGGPIPIECEPGYNSSLVSTVPHRSTPVARPSECLRTSRLPPIIGQAFASHD